MNSLREREASRSVASRSMRRVLRSGGISMLCAMVAIFAGCASPAHRVEFSGVTPMQDCPEKFRQSLVVSAQSLPIAVPAAVVEAGSEQTEGRFARRIVISTGVGGALRAARVTWMSVSIATFGGTFLGWMSLQTPFTVVDAVTPAAAGPLSPGAKTDAAEAAAVSFAPGAIKLIRSARPGRDLAGTVALDILVMPGGVEVDDTVLRVKSLWTKQGSAIPPSDVEFELVHSRHPPGYDTVEAGIDVEAVVQFGKEGDEWSCAAEGRVTIVDQESIRQPLWDIGIASSNGRRSRWLALSDPAAGIIRLVFDSPAAAKSFVSWIQTARPAQLGRYSLAVFEPTMSRTRRSFAPIDTSAMQTLRSLTPADFAALKIGALGED